MVEIDAKLDKIKRMQKQSAYVQGDGYKCSAIVAQMNNVQRKRAIVDKRHDPLLKRNIDGHINFMDVPLENENRRSLSSLAGLVELHRFPIESKQKIIPSQMETNAARFHALPVKKN